MFRATASRLLNMYVFFDMRTVKPASNKGHCYQKRTDNPSDLNDIDSSANETLELYQILNVSRDSNFMLNDILEYSVSSESDADTCENHHKYRKDGS